MSDLHRDGGKFKKNRGTLWPARFAGEMDRELFFYLFEKTRIFFLL
jgi:hypothetical protein